MRITYLMIVFISLFFLFATGCSRSESPLTPKSTPQNYPVVDSFPIGVSDYAPDGTPIAGMGVMGLFDLHLDTTSNSAELTSLRQSALTDVLEVVDLTNFLQMAPCTKCVKIRSVAIDSDGHLVVSIGIKHPFAAGDPFKPITGRNRADLHVFNIEGIVVSNATPTSFGSISESIAGTYLKNADGYTGYLDPSLDNIYPSAATIHPYILHFDDYSAGNFDAANPSGFASVTDPPPTGNLVMAMGCDYNVQDYVFDVSGSLDFIYAVGCTYALSAAKKSERFAPEYRVPQHNKKAASEVSISIISNNLAGGNATSTANLEIHVVDVSHGVEVGDALNQMKADSSVGQIIIEVPGVTTSPVTISGGSSISGTGHSPVDALIYSAVITNSASGGIGTYTGLVKVLDTYAPGQNTAPSLGAKDGIARVDPMTSPLTALFNITEFATYQAFTIDVGEGNEAPICGLEIPDNSSGQGGTVIADPGASSDPDGSIISYEYDTNYDGTTFTADVTQVAADPDFGDPISLVMPCNPTGHDITVQVALRVCDNGASSRCTICTHDVTVTPKLGDAGDITIIAINRGEGGLNANQITSVDLDWADNPCGVAEYAVEKGDGYNGTGWTVIGTSTTSDYKFKPVDNDLDDDMRLRVITRAVVGGDPSSDSDPSEEVFLLFVSNAGHITNNMWIEKTEYRNLSVFNTASWGSAPGPDPGADFDNWWGLDTLVVANGIVAWGYYVEHVGYTASTNRWSIMIPPYAFPDLEGQKEAYCDGFMWTADLSQWGVGSEGVCMGTVSNPNPNLSSPQLLDFKVANDVYGSGTPYTVSNIEGFETEFGASNQAGYETLGDQTTWKRVGFYLNDLLDPDRDYPALGFAVGNTPVPDRCVTVGWSDAWVFAID